MALDLSGVHGNLRKLRKILKKARHRPRPEQVHDLRTHTRQLEATLEALRLDGRRNECRLLATLGTLRKQAGKVRDMDVLTGYTVTVAVGSEQECLVELLEYLGSERFRHARRLRTLIRENGTALRRRLKRTAKRIEERLGADGAHDSGGGPVMPTDAIAAAVHLSKGLAQPATLTRTTLHPYRLKVKGLRNVLKMATDVDRNEFLVRLGEVKDAIGEWHDWETLIAIAAKQLDHGPRCRLLRQFRAIGDRKYQRALSLTNRMRKDHVRPRRGQLGRSVAQRLRATPVLEATAAIAS